MKNNFLVAIERAIKEGYIEGIHQRQNKNLVLRGFHKDFEMIVLKNSQIEKVDIDRWLERIEIMKKESPELWKSSTSYKYSL